MENFEPTTEDVKQIMIHHKPCGSNSYSMRLPVTDMKEEAQIVVSCKKCKVAEIVSEPEYKIWLEAFQKANPGSKLS